MLLMKKEVIQTADGSHTLELAGSGITYHSRRGAIRESQHVFIYAGLHCILHRQETPEPVRIFEMGFGTGLNTFLTVMEAAKNNIQIQYSTIESSPLFLEEVTMLNYTASLGHASLFQQLHQSNWNDATKINDFFTLEKLRTKLETYTANKQYHLIYYDAFAPSAQPELWTKEIFEKLRSMLLPNGVLVTYCAKGDVRRAMQAAGFTVKRLPGPPGKREMLRAEKLV
jgi:tRNA U34 5-methylaminomethyl-2-thiouridine-forming methyltransferase MnmC